MRALGKELQEKKDMVMVLVTKQAAILRDRYLLGKEVQLLKTQLVHQAHWFIELATLNGLSL